MAGRQITITVDEELVDALQALGAGPLSNLVNTALASEVDRRARSAALGKLLTGWDEAFGSVSDEMTAAAAASFAYLDATPSGA